MNKDLELFQELLELPSHVEYKISSVAGSVCLEIKLPLIETDELFFTNRLSGFSYKSSVITNNYIRYFYERRI